MPVYDLRRERGPGTREALQILGQTIAESGRQLSESMFRMRQLRNDDEYLNLAKQKIADAEKERNLKLTNEAIVQWGLQTLDERNPELVELREQLQGWKYPRSTETGKILPSFIERANQAALSETQARTAKINLDRERESMQMGFEREQYGWTREDRGRLEEQRKNEERAAKVLLKTFPNDPFTRYLGAVLKANPKASPDVALKNFSYGEMAHRATTGEITPGMEAYTDEDLRLIGFNKRPATETLPEILFKYGLGPEATAGAVAEAGSRYIPPPPPGMARVGGKLVKVGAAGPGGIQTPSGGIATPLPGVGGPAQPSVAPGTLAPPETFTPARGAVTSQAAMEAEVQRAIDELRRSKVDKATIKRLLAEAKAQGLEVR